MGCIYSSDNKDALKRSREIDKNIKMDFQKDKSTFKLLLLGAGESGKSTVVKQMKIIRDNGYTKEESINYMPIVFSNTIQSLTAIIRAMGQLKIEFQDPDRIEDARRVFALGNTVDKGSLNEELVSCMMRLWNDNGVLNCFKRSREYQLNDSAEYYLNSLERLAKSDYIPSVQDVLHTRVKTTGIIETDVDYKNVRLKIVDVGGQRSERRKWIHCFEGVTSMIFVVAISEYDQFLIEDSDINRMYESIKLFESVCNNQWFVKSSIILFLNKIDIFKLKITSSPLRICFPEYSGKNDYDEASEYIQSKFESLIKKEGKVLYIHFTCATDTSNISRVFNVIIENLISKNVESIGIF